MGSGVYIDDSGKLKKKHIEKEKGSMTKDELKNMFAKVAENEEFKGAVKNCATEEELVAVLKQFGCEVTVEQLREEVLPAMKENGELDEAALEAVSGGKSLPQIFYEFMTRLLSWL